MNKVLWCVHSLTSTPELKYCITWIFWRTLTHNSRPIWSSREWSSGTIDHNHWRYWHWHSWGGVWSLHWLRCARHCKCRRLWLLPAPRSWMDWLDDDTSEDKKDNEGSLTTPNKVHRKVKLSKVDCCLRCFAALVRKFKLLVKVKFLLQGQILRLDGGQNTFDNCC